MCLPFPAAQAAANGILTKYICLEKRRKRLKERNSRIYSKKTVLCLSIILIVLIAVIIWIWRQYGYRDSRYETTGFAMGSFIQQTLYGEGAEDTAGEAASSITELENKISWRVEDSDIASINDNAGSEWVEIDPSTTELLALCLQVAEDSGGAYDPTILPISRLWNFDSEDPQVPSPNDLETYLPYIDYTNLRIDKTQNLASLRNHYMAVDLGSAGKGAACDAAVAVYKESDISCGIIAVGGSVGTYGQKPDGSLWEIAVRNPYSEENGETAMGTLSLKGGFLSTSGSYEKTFSQEGKTYHHLLDPKTGMPVENGLVSVTIVSDSGALSDILSTACFVLGEEKGMELLEQYDAEGIFIRDDRTVRVTSGLKDSFQIVMEEFTYAE